VRKVSFEFERGKAKLIVPSFTRLLSTRERRINILQQHNTPFRRVRQQVIELVVRQSSLGEVENADVVIERAGEGLDEGGFAGAGRTVEEVASSVRNSCEIESISDGRRSRRGKPESAPRCEYHRPRPMNALTSFTTLSFTPSSNTTLSNSLFSLGRPKGLHSAPHAV
jgi:hypothetical protein